VALTAASERVNAKFGFYCTSASAQLQEILERTRPYPENSTVEILSI
jgi:uncharacterized repeat protein (TIGR04042 family)